MSGVSGFNLLPQVASLFAGISDKLVEEAASQVATIAKQICPVDTGSLQSTIYVKTHDASTYGQGFEEPTGDSYILPEVDVPPSGTAYVAAADNYAIYVEFGTRYMGAEPFMIPALETVGLAFQNGTMLQGLLSKELGGLGI